MAIKNIENIPVLRGISAFIDSLFVGVKCLMYSAEFFEEEDAEDGKAADASEKADAGKAADAPGKADAGKAADAEKGSGGLSTGETVLTVVLSIAMTVGLFILLPYFLASILRHFGAGEVAVSLAEAVLRILIFIGYILLISRMKDIQRVFMYHGSEHKCINCIEHGLPLTVENVAKSSRQHKRCGTSFLLYVVVLSVIFFVILGLFGITSPLLRLLLRLLLIPVIAGLAYEIIRLAGRSENRCVLALSKPGMMLQMLVTKEPDDQQIEVAIAAVEAVFDWKAYLAENFPDAAV